MLASTTFATAARSLREAVAAAGAATGDSDISPSVEAPRGNGTFGANTIGLAQMIQIEVNFK